MARLSSAAAQAARAKMAALDETMETDSESGDSKPEDPIIGPHTKDSDGDSEDTPIFDSEVAIECLLDDCGSAYERDTVTLYIHVLGLTVKQVKHLREA